MSLTNSFVPVRKVSFVVQAMPGDEQVPFEVDHICCPKCQKIQTATILHGWSKYKYRHRCIECGYSIEENEWNSIQ